MNSCLGGEMYTGAPSTTLPTNPAQVALRSRAAIEVNAAHVGETTIVAQKSSRNDQGDRSKHSVLAASPLSVEDFKKAVGIFTLKNYLKQEFVLVHQLDRWMQERPNPPSPNSTRLFLLLTDAYKAFRGIDNHPLVTAIMDDLKLSSKQSRLRLLCVLLQIGAGHLIETMSQFLCDDELPLSLEYLESALVSRKIITTAEDAHKLAKRFYETQFSFCCQSFQKRQVTRFSSSEILPIVGMEPVNDKGRDANIYRIEIPLEYVAPPLRDIVNNDHQFEVNGITYFEFAVKSFSNPRAFLSELSIFTVAQEIHSVVKWFSHYEVQSSIPNTHDKSNCQYNLVLELGRFDLDQLILSTRSPVLFRDVFEVWSSLGAVVDALSELHSLRGSLTGTDELMIEGWHADLKPDNILRVGNTWRLADIGFAKFRLNLGRKLGKADFVGGTVTYGAPETLSCPGTEMDITPLLDIWSLGAVFSVVATWVVLGASGVAHYKRVRQAAIHSRITAQPPNNRVLPTGDYFHDGQQTLQEVTAWHDFLRYSVRMSDPLTGKILNMVDQFMLRGDARLRHSAADVNREYKTCLKEADSANLEPQGASWWQHRNTIALAEQELSDDEPQTSQPTKPLGAFHRLSRSAPGSPQQCPRNLKLPMAQPEHLSLRPFSKGRESPNRATGERVIGPAAPRPSSAVRFQGSLRDPSNERYNMSWARKDLRLDEKRYRSPTRSLLRSAAKKVGMKQKSERSSDIPLASVYKDRNIVFLVDNGASMREHWSGATTLLETLLAMTKGVGSPRSIDLRFTFQTHISVTHERNLRQFMRAMDAAQPMTLPSIPGLDKTDMAAALSGLFAEYKEKIRRARGLSIIVLTDGNWVTGTSGDVQEEIAKFAGQFGRPYPRHRPFNIEFVWLGSLEGPPKKLTDLDGQTKDSRNLGPIVNTENSTGSVYRMLLGSLADGSDSEKREALRTPFPKEDEPFDPDSD
ncbi:hypothetical protein QBC34DRAFT_87472 [Podospora aff. communis PSN243]|uniref:Protein kinase domain-containing protein n=1 Tax=Podospora aff. communis PSN243 TaxID=3040156 RepID=A0AAV9GNX2_9PEZI|nr:hypothetical protein QBC34DRAFT_87472 [Podospora aff. communis PSN243]